MDEHQGSAPCIPVWKTGVYLSTLMLGEMESSAGIAGTRETKCWRWAVAEPLEMDRRMDLDGTRPTIREANVNYGATDLWRNWKFKRSSSSLPTLFFDTRFTVGQADHFPWWPYASSW